jgi:hypothetical protein
LAQWLVLVIPSYTGNTNRRIVVQAGPGIKQDPISKITNTKKAGNMVQKVEYLPNKHQALSSPICAAN